MNGSSATPTILICAAAMVNQTPPRRKTKPKAKGNKPHKTHVQLSGVTDTQARFAILVSSGTGISPRVIAAWELAEGGPDDNPLNIGPGNHYGDTDGAAKATVTLLHSSLYKGILAAAQSGKNDAAVIHAIAASPWCPNCAGYEALLLGTLARVGITGWNGSGGVDSITGWDTKGSGIGIDNPVGGLDGIATALQDIVKFLARIVSPDFLQRVGKIILGALALIIGGVLLARAALGVDASMSDTVKRRARTARAEKDYRRTTDRQAERAHAVTTARRQAKDPRPKPERIRAPKPGGQKGSKISPNTPLTKFANDEAPF